MVVVLALAALAVGSSWTPAATASPHPRLCLALSGGGARGLAEVGVLQAFESAGLHPDCVAGTSMGALVGSLYASGYSPAEMETIVGSLDWQSVFSGKPERPLVPLALRIDDIPAVGRVALAGGRVRLPAARDSDYRTNRLLFRLLAEPGFRSGGDFDRLRLPFRAVATDLANGEQVVLASGSLVRAVRASLSTPVKLLPVRLDGRLLVDGGLVQNLPTAVARDLGADVVVAVDVRSPPLQPKPADSFVDTTAVVVDLLMRDRNERSSAPPDVLIDLRKGLEGFAETDYARYAEALAIGRRVGREGALRVAERVGVARTSGSGNGAVSHANAQTARLEGTPVREIVVRGTSRVRESVIRRALALTPGRPFVMDEALRGLDAVYATRLFESVSLDAAPAGANGASLTVEVREAPRLSLELGGGFDEADEARGFLRIRNRNLLGRGERSDTTLLASDGEVGVRTAFTAERPWGLPVGLFTRGHLVHEKPRVFESHEAMGRARFRRQGLAVGVLHPLGTAGLLRVGLARDTVRTLERRGVPLPAGKDALASVFGEAAWDTLDDRALPGRGALATLFAARSLEGLGGSRSYWRVLARAQAAATPHARLTVRGQVRGALSGGALPVYEQARLGHPLVPGLQRDELWGAQVLAGSASVATPVFRDLRLVARLGAGQASESRSALRSDDFRRGFGLGLELPSRLGPVTVDWGRSGGVSRAFISIGFPWEQAPIR